MKEPVVTIREDASLRNAALLLKEHRFNSLPVVSQQERLVGILSTWDILRALV